VVRETSQIEQKQGEETLRVNEERFHTLAVINSEGIAITEAWRIVYGNKQPAEMLA
jgi:hypothetical protein